MGTRGITKVIYEGNTAVSQYGQWDHYPSGQGLVVFEFLRGDGNIDKLKNSIKTNIYVPSVEALDDIYANYTNENGMSTMEQNDEFSDVYPSLSRDTGSGILEVISNATQPIPLYLDLDFENDTLMCEGVYTINLDDNTFTTLYDGEETVIKFEDIYNMGKEDYLVKSKCSVYEYQQGIDKQAVA
jgi:hypothetical protein